MDSPRLLNLSEITLKRDTKIHNPVTKSAVCSKNHHISDYKPPVHATGCQVMRKNFYPYFINDLITSLTV